MTRKRLEEILARHSSRLARRYRQVMQRARDQRSVSELETALSEGRIVDRLSLYLSLRGHEDERVNLALQSLLEEMRW